MKNGIRKLTMHDYGTQFIVGDPIRTTSNQFLKVRGCLSKKDYFTIEAAEKEVKRQGPEFHYYLCEFCRRYHIGHIERRTQIGNNKLSKAAA